MSGSEQPDPAEGARPRTWVDVASLAEALKRLEPLDAEKFRSDVDRIFAPVRQGQVATPP